MKLKIAVGVTLALFAIVVTGIFVAALITRENNRANQADTGRPDQTNETAQTGFTAAQVAEHSVPTNCWLIIHGSVYDVTEFIAQHPGGAEPISGQCGKEASQAFEAQDGTGTHSQEARGMMANYKVGVISDQPADAAANEANSQAVVQESAPLSVPAIVNEKYPGASIQKNEIDDDGEQKIEIISNGACREIRVTSQGQISRDEPC